MSYFTSKRFKAEKVKRFLVGTIGILVVLIFWAVLSKRFHPLILPSPGETFAAIKELLGSGKLFSNVFITVRRTFIGYSLAILAGSLLAFILKSSRFWQYFFRPLITIIQTTPPVLWIALAVIWFGIADDLTPIFLIFIVTFPIIFVNVFSGLDSIDKGLVEMARFYRTSHRKILFWIYLPSLIPHLVSAASIGLAFAWKSTIFAEFIGSSSGIGFELSMANSNLHTEKLFAWAIVLIFLMLFLEYGLIQPLKAYVTRWNKDE
ncbi:MAG: ABC transporter permease [Bacillota bacterium]